MADEKVDTMALSTAALTVEMKAAYWDWQKAVRMVVTMEMMKAEWRAVRLVVRLVASTVVH